MIPMFKRFILAGWVALVMGMAVLLLFPNLPGWRTLHLMLRVCLIVLVPLTIGYGFALIYRIGKRRPER